LPRVLASLAGKLLDEPSGSISLSSTAVEIGRVNLGCFIHTAEAPDGRRAVFFEKRTLLDREINFCTALAEPYLADPIPVLPRIYKVSRHKDYSSIFMDFVPSVGSDFERGEDEAVAFSRAVARISAVDPAPVPRAPNVISQNLVRQFAEITAEQDLLAKAGADTHVLFDDCLAHVRDIGAKVQERLPVVPSHNDLGVANIARLDVEGRPAFCFVDWGKYSLNFAGADFHHFYFEAFFHGTNREFLDTALATYVRVMGERGYSFSVADVKLAATYYTLQRIMSRVLNRPSNKWVEIALELFKDARAQSGRNSGPASAPPKIGKQVDMSMIEDLKHRASEAVAAKDWKKAAELWEAVLEGTGNDVGIHARLARALRQIGDYDRAEAVLAEGEAIDPGNERLQAERNALSLKLQKSSAKAPGNVYHGNTAITYHERRKDSNRWKTEDRAVGRFLGTLPEGISVIDLPFGTGRFTEFYVARNICITGVDISDDMLSAARQIYGAALNNATLEVGDATALKYADNAFDLVVSVRFLQNIIPYGMVKLALKEMARVTKSWGILEFEVRKDDAVDAGMPGEGDPLRGLMYQHQIDAMLAEVGFRTKDVASVYDNGASSYCILLCEVTGG
jgi:ubiquinone/menaquinone biosynthesis C-methylase UbiE